MHAAWSQYPLPVAHGARTCANRPTRTLQQCSASKGSSSGGGKGKDVVMEGLKEFASFLAPSVAAISASVNSSQDGTPSIPSSSSSSSSRARSGESSSSSSSASSARPDWQSPVYALLLVNVLAFLVLPNSAALLRLGAKFQWHQLLASGFAHTDLAHLAETSFLVYTFGRLLERSHGAWAMWGTYIVSVLGANLFALWLLPSHAKGAASVALSAASAGAWGLFVAGLAWPRLGRKPLEVLALAPFVVSATCARYAPVQQLLVSSGTPVGHLVHLVGAALSASLVAGLLFLVDLARLALEEQRRAKEQEEYERLRASRAKDDGQAMADVLGTAAKAASILAKKIVT